MKIIFVTEKKHRVEHPDIQIVSKETGKRLAYQLLAKSSIISNDYETTGENPYLKRPILSQWHNTIESDPIIIIDHTSIAIGEVVTNELLHNKTLLAHNADFEARWNIRYGLTNGEYICTMVNELVILCGADISASLLNSLIRRGIPIPEEMNKDIRSEFIDADLDTFVLENRHIFYNAADGMVLPRLWAKQQQLIYKADIWYLIHIRSQVVKALAQAELTGFVHNNEKWIKIAQDRQVKANKIIDQLNEYITTHGIEPGAINTSSLERAGRREKSIATNQARLAKCIANIERIEQKGRTTTRAYKQLQDSKEKYLQFTPAESVEISVNWSSPKQVLEILVQLKLNRLPETRDKKTYQLKPGIGKEARNNWLADNIDDTHYEFMKTFDELQKTTHNIESFGEQWIITYTNPVTGKVHTCFRQAGTRTGRAASGDVDSGYFNLQQIPKEVTEYPDGRKIAEYRACFTTDPGRSMTTLDYTGCEIVCMISLSRDLELKRISELADQHSYMGTKCWRAVYADRYERDGKQEWKDLSESFEMKKGKMREKFKNSGVFPVIYGVRENKVAAVQGFSPLDAAIFIKTIEAEMPNVVTFVKGKAQEALSKGYVIHNTRTNSRRWFTEVLEARREGRQLLRRQVSLVDNAARNAPIQGTNADIIWEAIVLIYRWSRRFKVDVRLLGQVHDELIYDHPDHMNDWIKERLKTAMKKAAKAYLIAEIDMDVDVRQGKTWLKD